MKDPGSQLSETTTLRPITITAAFFGKILLLSFVVGASTAFLDAGDGPRLSEIAIGGLSGLLIGLGCSSLEIFVLSNRANRWLRKAPFVVIVGLRAVGYSLIIFLALVTPTLAAFGKKLWLQPDFQQSLLLSVLIASGFSLAIELARLLGKEATLALFTGRYRRPRIERRIVMFADLVGSTARAEAMGDLRFHELLADLSYDLAEPIEAHRGETHRYVGDAVIITWPMQRDRNFDLSVACAEGMMDVLSRNSEIYAAKYGAPLRMRIALHCGDVAAGEIGYWKKEIALLGDTMNTAARIEAAARDFGADIVMSDAIASRLSPERRRALAPLPDYRAAGKQDQLKLWALAAPSEVGPATRKADL